MNLRTNDTKALVPFILLLLAILSGSGIRAQNFHVFMSMEMSYNDAYTPGKFQWVARMYINKTGTSSFNDRRFEKFVCDFSWDTTKLKNPRYYVVVNKTPILMPGISNYKDTQGQYVVKPYLGSSASVVPPNHIRDSVVVEAYNLSLADTLYAGANFNSCLNCGEIFRVYFDIDSTSSNVPPVYYPNGIDANPVYWNPQATGFLADTVYDHVSTAHHVIVPPSPAQPHWFQWPYDATGSGSSAGGLNSSEWQILTGTGGNTSSWAFAGYTGGYLYPLPVTYLNFDALFAGDAVLLNWTTSMEDNNSHFDVERSSDGLEWIKIGRVYAGQLGANLSHYSFLDALPAAGYNFYRLQQFDFNGHSAFSSIRVVNIGAFSESGFLVYPIPAGNSIQVMLNAYGDEDVQLELISPDGRKLMGFSTDYQTQMQIDISELQPGMYYLYLKGENGIQLKQIIKQ